MRDPLWDAQMFVGLTRDPDKETPSDLIQYVRHEIEATCAADVGEDERQYQAYMRGLDEIWPVLEAKMKASYGLAEYMRIIGSRSLFLPRYYAELYHPMSMVAPFGWARRIDGKFLPIPENDPGYSLAAREFIFRTVRTRTALQQIVQAELGDDILSLLLGAGMAPEMIRFRWQDRGIRQRVIAYDNAPGTLQCIKQIYNEKPLASYGIEEYREDSYWNAFKDPDLQCKSDLVGMEGGLSYNYGRFDELFEGIARLLRPGGHFCGETELMNIYTVRCGILGWKMDQPMHLYDSADDAIRHVEEASAKAGMKILEAIVDDQNPIPAMVWFHLQKI